MNPILLQNFCLVYFKCLVFLFPVRTTKIYFGQPNMGSGLFKGQLKIFVNNQAIMVSATFNYMKITS